MNEIIARNGAVLFGDSFCFGLLQHLLHKGYNVYNIAKALKASDLYERVQLIGRAGGDTSHLQELYDRLNIKQKQTLHTVLIDLGTNELAKDCSPNRCLLVAYKIMEFAEVLIKKCGVKHVIVCQILPRVEFLAPHIDPEQFWDAMYRTNSFLIDWCEPETQVHYWVHQGFWARPLVAGGYGNWSNDGIHPNTPIGRKLYKNSLRRALMRGRQKSLVTTRTRGGKAGKKSRDKKKGKN